MSRIRDIAKILSGSTDMATDAEVAASYVPLSSAAANQIMYKNSSNVASGSSGLQYDGTSIKVNGNLESVYTNGDEGGEIFLNKATTNTTITNGVTVDVFQNKLRFFENGGSNRGYYLDITSGGNSAGTNLVSSGGMTLIQEVVASASPGISFSSIPQTYKQLVLVWSGVQHSGSGSQFHLRINNDSGSNYTWVSLYNTNAVTGQANTGTKISNDSAFGEQAYNSLLYQVSFGSFLLDNYVSTSKAKYYNYNFGYRNAVNGYAQREIGNGVWNSTSAVTSLDIVRTVGTATISNFTNTSIRLYGVN